MPVGDAFCAVEGKPRGVAPCPHQRLCLWTPRRFFDPLDTHFAIELSALSGYARVLIRARRREIPCICEKAATVARPTMWSCPFGATICGKLDRAAWGRSCGSAKLLAGTLRCLHLCWRLPWNWSPAQQLGRCPKPHKGRRPLTLQGTLSLDPFWLPGLGALPLLLLFRRFFCLFLRLFLLIQGFFPIKHLPHLPLRFLHHPVALLNRVLLRVVINLRPE